jgi:uncharacterized protein YkwD
MIQKAPSVVALAVRPLRRPAYAAAIIVMLVAALANARPVAAAGDCTVSATDAAIDSDEQAMLTAINTYRQQNGLGALASSSTLNRSAAWLSNDMAAKRALNQTDSLGRDQRTRMKDCGATFTSADEAVAIGADVAAALQMWKASAPQNALLLAPGFKAAGIARAVSTATPTQTYWTLDLSDTVESGSGSTTTAGAGGSTQSTSTSAQPGMGTVSVTVSLVNAAGQTAAAGLSGFQFVLEGSTGAYATPPTNEQGVTSLAVPAGTYTVTQEPRTGATLVSISGGATAGSTTTGSATTGNPTTGNAAATGSVTVTAGMTASVAVVDRIAGTSPATTAATNPSGTITNPTANPLTNTSPFLNPAINPLSNPFTNNPLSNPFVNNPLSSPLVNPTTNPLLNPALSMVPATGATTTGATTITSAATTSTATESVSLANGCNNVSMTWAAGTPISTVAAAVSGSLDAIWRWDSARNMYLGYSAKPGAPSDYTAVGAKLEAAFICVNAAGSLTRPAG